MSVSTYENTHKESYAHKESFLKKLEGLQQCHLKPELFSLLSPL